MNLRKLLLNIILGLLDLETWNLKFDKGVCVYTVALTNFWDFFLKKSDQALCGIHTAIFSSMITLFLFSGIQGGSAFLPIFAGLSVLFYRNFLYFQKITEELPLWCQWWVHDDKNNKRNINIVYEAENTKKKTTPNNNDQENNTIIDLSNELHHISQ